jgi:hypothetical protein
MSEWANAPSELRSTAVRVTAAVLVGLNLIFFVYSLLPAGDGSLLRYTLVFEAVLGIAYRRRVRAVLNSIDGPAKELATLGLALQRMERETFSSERLRQLQTDFAKETKRPSREIAFLVTLVENLNYRRNEFFLILSFPLLWATQFTFAIEAWRRRRGPAIGGWLANFGEFEALCALASYSYEHPEDSFPEVVEGAAILEFEEVRHPLLPRASCVPNSLNLGGELQLLLVSGSNMSGKSTLLRTVGINVVLAQAGGPVRAARNETLCARNWSNDASAGLPAGRSLTVLRRSSTVARHDGTDGGTSACPVSAGRNSSRYEFTRQSHRSGGYSARSGGPWSNWTGDHSRPCSGPCRGFVEAPRLERDTSRIIWKTGA